MINKESLHDLIDEQFDIDEKCDLITSRVYERNNNIYSSNTNFFEKK